MRQDVKHSYQAGNPAGCDHNHSDSPGFFFDRKSSVEIKHQIEPLEEVSDCIAKTYPDVNKKDFEDNEGSKNSDSTGCFINAVYAVHAGSVGVGRTLLLVTKLDY